MFRSAVFKLTAAYVLIIMAVCIVFSVVLYHLAVRELQTGFYNEYTRWFNAYEHYGLHNPGTPAEELAKRSSHILSQLIYFNIFVLILTSLICFILARRTLRPIEAAHEQQKRFTADVSHELRTPLTALKMEAQVALMNPKAPTKELRQTLRSSLEEVEHMETLVNNLLLLSSMEAGKLRSEFRQLDIQEVVQSAIDTVSKMAASKSIILKPRLRSAHIDGDQASLTQLFVILLENAIKYSPENSIVTIGMLRGKGRVVVDIQDKGLGIAPEALPHIFDRFYRADSARTKGIADKSAQGFGLGLSLAKLIADLHRSEIVVTSTAGHGTNVSVIFDAG